MKKEIMKKSLLFVLFLLISRSESSDFAQNRVITNYCFAQEKPDLIIISPQEEETIFGDKAVCSFFVSNFLLGIDGYLRISLDQRGPLTIKEQKDISLTDLSEGKHALVAELVDKKTRPLSPSVKKEVVFLSILPKEEREINLEISPSKRKGGEILLPISLGLLGFGGVVFLILAFKFYINAKTGQNRSHQKPLS